MVQADLTMTRQMMETMMVLEIPSIHLKTQTTPTKKMFSIIDRHVGKEMCNTKEMIPVR